MPHTLLAYSTTDGQTLRICARLQAALEGAGHMVTVTEITDGLHCDLQSFDTVVIGASIRYGKHRPAVLRFVEFHRHELQAKGSAFFSVNVVARKPGKDTADTNPYVQTFLRKTAWKPKLVGVFAGRIDYPRYGAFDRQIIRLIMWLTKGPTDPSSSTEFTNWQAVDAFAAKVKALQS
jgi:menaquinone-dependent protoporphyrinogen oxidase